MLLLYIASCFFLLLLWCLFWHFKLKRDVKKIPVTIIQSQPTYSIRQVNGYYTVEKENDGYVYKMSTAFVTDPNYKHDNCIWLYQHGGCKNTHWSQSGTVHCFLSFEVAKESLDLYLSDKWLKPVNKIVYTHTPIVPTDKELNYIHQLMDAVEKGDTEAELQVLEKLRVEYKK